ncbi:MAG: 2-oxoacid:acceptor oxidoreductase subunit alpha [Patescibacteria group bacterium]|jgi:2-oxoglutarate ferredoxin oxidoreductase subunit alpha
MQNKNNLTWKIAGEAGFGIKSAGMMFGKIFMRAGYELFDFTEYPSIIRGGHNTYQLVIDTKPVNSVYKYVDILVALNQNTIKYNIVDISSGGVLIYDSDKVKVSSAILKNNNIEGIAIPLTTLAKEAGGDLMRNVVALGATMCLVGQDLTIANKVVKETFARKGEVVVANNIKALKSGFDFVKANVKNKFKCQLPTLPSKDNILITANEALALGAVAGGLGFYSAYPMTPSSSILHYLAKIATKTGIVVKHAEDEISVANMALGASHVGVRSMLATSGGGFSLMTETLGLVALTETPLVMVNVQRSGPATGLPTWTEQADLQFMLHGAQGDFPRIIMAPGDAGEAYEMGYIALNWADMYQLPVIILSDKLIGEGNTTVPRFNTKNVKINRGKILTQAQLSKSGEYKRYKVTSDGISPRTLPGTKNGLFIANSDEHDSYGFSNEDSQNRIEQVDKRQRKLDTFAKLMPQPLIYGNPKAKKTVVFWGSNKGVILDAYVSLPDKVKSKIKIMQYQYLWPFAADFTSKILQSSKDILLIENNPNGQLGNLIAQETGVLIKHKMLKYDGRPFFREDIIDALKKL